MEGVKSKLPGIAETIFTTMSKLAREYKAINMGQGFPDFDMDPLLIALVHKAMQDGYNQYTHQNGLPELRAAIAEKVEFLYRTHIDPQTQICITPGATYGIYTALTTLLRPGDEVIIFEPAYDSYLPNILINGARPVPVSLVKPDFRIDWEKVKQAITPDTKALILNSPHNPSGAILSREDIEELKQIVNQHKIYIVSDEVYEHLIFDGRAHESMLKYPELLERSFVLFSFGKIYHCTGWKMGYAIAPPHLMNEFNKVHQYNAFCCNTPVQYALAEYLQNKAAYLSLGEMFSKKRDLLSNALSSSGWKPAPSSGSFFQLYDYSGLSALDEISFAVELAKQAGVAAIPVSPFYADQKNQQLLRFCFAKKDETILEVGARLQQFAG